MADLWYPNGVRDAAPQRVWGYRISSPAKHVLHTTEGGPGVYTPGQGSYYGTQYWPNYTLAKRGSSWVIFQHVPSNRSAAALAHPPGTGETNRAVSQTEIAWKASQIEDLPGEALAALEALLNWEHETMGLPLRSTVSWIGYPASYGSGAVQRLGQAGFANYSGILGHQHVPGNDHGDPGRFPMGKLLGASTAQEDEMSAQDVKAIKDGIDDLKDRVWDVRYKRAGDTGHQDNNLETVLSQLGDVMAKLDSWGKMIGARFDRLDAAVGVDTSSPGPE